MAKPDPFRSWPRVWNGALRDEPYYPENGELIMQRGGVAYELPFITSGSFGIFETAGLRYPYRVECLICGVVVDRIYHEHLEQQIITSGLRHPQDCDDGSLCQDESCACDYCMPRFCLADDD